MKRIHILAIGLLIAFAVSLQAVQSVINVGSSANDGTGDTLRSAMQKVNSNFTELYGTIFNFNSNQFGSTTSTNIFIKSGAPLTNSVLYGSTSGSWTVGTTGNLTADTARTVTTTSGSLTLASGSSHVVLSPSSSVGVGTTGPDAKLDVLSTSGSQYRATYTDGSVYSDWGTLSTGATLWTNSLGNRMTSTTVNDTSVLARQVQGGLAFDGVTNAKDLHTLTTDIGTSDCSVAVTFQCPSTNPSFAYGVAVISSSSTTYNVARSIYIDIESSGQLICYLGGSAAGYARLLTLTGFVSSYGGRLVNIVFVKSSSGNTAKLYVNGVDSGATESTAGASPPAWTDTVISTYAYFGQLSSSYLLNTPIFGAWVFNRALSASEVITLANQGVSEADKWGSLTAAYNSNRSGGWDTSTDSWTASNVTTTAPITQDGEASTMRIVTSATTSTHSSARTMLTIGKKYTCSYRYYFPSGNSIVTGFQLWQGGSSVLDAVSSPVVDTWTTRTVAVFTATNVNPSFYLYAGASSSFAANGTDVMYLKDVTFTQVGSILDADLSAGVGYQVPDRSSNKYHGVVSATGTSWTQANRRGQIRYTTTGATTGAFQLLSSTAIPANALIQSIVAWSAGTPLVYVGTATGTSNIVGHTTLVGSTYTPLTLSSQFSTTGNLWINKSATNEVNLTVNYMISDP